MNQTYAYLLFLSALAAVVVTYFAWHRCSAPGGNNLAYLGMATIVWVVCYGFYWLAAGVNSQKIWWNLMYTGVVAIPFCYLAFVLRYTNQVQWLPRQTILLLAIEPFITLVILWTDPLHGLFSGGSQPVGPLSHRGIWYWLNFAYSYTILIYALYLLVRAWLVTVRPLRPQLGIIILATLMPMIANLSTVLGAYLFDRLDLTPLVFVVSYICFAFGFFRFRLFDVVPIARSAIFERMADGCIVLDAQNRVVDVNQTALKMLGKTPETVIGQPAEEALAKFGDLFQRFPDTLVLRQEIEPSAEPPLTLDLRITPLYDRRGRHSGRLIVARDVTDRKKAERSEREQRILAETLRDTASALNRAHSFDKVLDQILDPVGRVIPYDLATLFLIGNDDLAYAARHRGYREHGLDCHLHVLHIPIDKIPNFQRMMKTGNAIVVPDTRQNKYWVEGMEKIRSYVCAPIRVRENVIGFLDLLSFTPGFFSQVHADRLQAFANQAAIAIENVRLFEEIQQHADQMAALFDIGLTLTSGLDTEHILKTLLKKCQKILPVEAFYVAFFDPETELVHHPLFYDRGEYLDLPARSIREQPGLSGYVIQTRQTLYLPDTLENGISEQLQMLHAGGESTRSYVGVPMTVGERVVGVISMQSYRPNAYSPAQIRILETIATQAAAAAENARLFAEVHQHAEEMTALFDIGITVTSGLEMDQVLKTLLEKCRQVLPVEAFYVAIFDAERHIIHHPLAYDLGEYPQIPSRDIRESPGLGGLIINSQQTLYIPDLLSLEAVKTYQIFHTSGTPTRSYVGVPMIIGERVVGVISIQSYHPNAYTSEHIRLLETIATQAAIAIENSRLYAKAQQEIVERERAEHRYRALFGQSHDAVFIIGFDGKYTEVNQRAAEMLGYSQEELLELDFSDMSAQRPKSQEVFEKLLRGETVPLYERELRKKDGETIIVEINAELVYDADGNPLHIQSVVRDITERKRDELALQEANEKLRRQLEEINELQDKLREQATRDSLTGLYNRRYLEETLQREFALAERHNSTVCLVMIDIDGFKGFNDTYGHDAGDFLLKGLGDLLRKGVRRSDISCRYGGEEFLIVMPGAPLKKGVERAERIRKAFRAGKFRHMGTKLDATLSLGVAIYPDHGQTWEEVIHAADRAMYGAKAAGKNRTRSARD